MANPPESFHKKKHQKKDLTLRRNLGLLEATSVGVGMICGAGIYILIGAATGMAGNSVWLAFLISAVVALFTGFSYAELSSLFPKDAGEYVYADEAFGRKVAHIVGWLILIAGIIATATVAFGFGSYFYSMVGTPIVVTALVIIALFTAINIIGVKQSTFLNIIMTLIEVGGLLLIIGLSFRHLGSVDYMEMPFGFNGVFSAAALIFFAFIGFECVVKMSEETRNPERTIPKALLLSIAITTVLYVLVAVSAVSVLGWEKIGASSAPLADVAAAAFGPKAFLVLGVIALFSTANTILIDILTTSRLAYGMGADKSLPTILARIHPKTKTPWIAVIFVAAAAGLFVLWGNLHFVAELTDFAIFLTFIIVNLALIMLRYKMPDRKRMFKAPFNIGRFNVSALLGILLCFFLISHLSRTAIEGGIILTLIGFVFYRWYEFFEKVEIKVRYKSA